MVVTISGGAGSNGQDVTLTLNRSNQTAAYREDVVSPQQVKVGTWPVAVRLFAQPNGGGDLVGRADATPAIQANGNGIGSIATTGLVASVEVTPNQSLLVDEKKDLTFTARNADGQVLAVTPGSGFFTVISGGDRLRMENGLSAEALKPGNATLRASVDGINSANGTVTITSNTVVEVNPQTLVIGVNSTSGFTANVTNAPDTGVTWSLQEGATGGTATSTGANTANYTAPGAVGTFHLVATSQYDTLKTGAATITVIPVVTVQPSPVTTTLRKDTQFVATVAGVSDTGVDWSIQEGASGGTIDGSGKYTAPATPGVYHVVAASRADNRAKATVTVNVKAGSGTVIIQ